MLPTHVTVGNQEMEDEDISIMGDGAITIPEFGDNSSELEFDPSELLRSPLFDGSDDELERIPSSCELGYEQEEQGDAKLPAAFDRLLFAQVPMAEAEAESQMVLDNNGFPVKAKKRRSITEEQRPRRIPGLVKDKCESVGRQGSLVRQQKLRDLQSIDAEMSYNEVMLRANSSRMMEYSSTEFMHMDEMDDQYMERINMMNTSPSMQVPNEMNTIASCESQHQVAGDLKTYNEAMGKLCESMKRSQMTRNLVKQLSNQTVNSTNSLSSVGSNPAIVSRQSSARSMNAMSQHGSTRSLINQASGRGLNRQISVHSVDGMPGQVSPYPDHHRHQLPRQGEVFRHNSSNAIMDRKRPHGGPYEHGRNLYSG